MAFEAAFRLQMRHDRDAMSSDWIESGFGEDSPEELARSMEHEIEGLLELDDFDLPGISPGPPLPPDCAPARAADRRDRVTRPHG